MCIVIDINTLAPVFDENNYAHDEFVSVKTWISKGNGFLVFGGSEYKRELKNTSRFLRLIRLMKDGGQAISISDAAVDQLEIRVRAKTAGSICDDQHIIALLGASRCSMLCSLDKRAYPFVKNRRLYPSGAPRVRIYRSSKNADLLTKTHWRTLSNRANETL